MALELVANNYSTRLVGGCSNVDTTITVTDSPPAALAAGGQFRILIEQEYMLGTAVGGTGNKTWTVVRGNNLRAPDTCAAASHMAGLFVTHLVTAGTLGQQRSRGREAVYYIEDYGGGTGVADNTSAMQTALDAIVGEWRAIRHNPRALHPAQARWAAEQAAGLEEHFARRGCAEPLRESGAIISPPVVPLRTAVDHRKLTRGLGDNRGYEQPKTSPICRVNSVR